MVVPIDGLDRGKGEKGYVRLPLLPDIGLEGKLDLIAEMRVLAF